MNIVQRYIYILAILAILTFLIVCSGCITNPPSDRNLNTTFITIDPINPHKAGDSFNISGITNIGSDRQIWVEIVEDYFGATRIRKDGKFYGVAGNATINEGTNGINRWEFHVNTSGWLPQQYYVNVFPASHDENYSKVHSTLNITS